MSPAVFRSSCSNGTVSDIGGDSVARNKRSLTMPLLLEVLFEVKPGPLEVLWQASI